MNTGIQDGLSLASALAQTLRDGQDARLDAWAAKRHRIATDVVTMTDRMTRVATMKSRAGKVLRNAVLGMVGYVPGVRSAIAKNLAELNT